LLILFNYYLNNERGFPQLLIDDHTAK